MATTMTRSLPSVPENEDAKAPALRGRGRGAGRGAGNNAPRGRGAGRGGRGGPDPTRHSSYVPSDDVRRGSQHRPRSNYSSSEDSNNQTTNEESNGQRRPLANSAGTLANSCGTVRGTPETVRKLPIPSAGRLSSEQAPAIPPRSPPSTPRAGNLPALPPRILPQPATTPENPPTGGGHSASYLRDQCLQEIYQTEKDYIADLETLIDIFIFPLRTMGVVDEQKLYSIFSNVESLIHCNKEMLKGLETVMSGSNSSITIGDVFTQLAEYFKMYKVYCANQQNSLQTVEQLTKKNPQFKRNLDVCHSDPRCKGLFLQSFLIKPIQRVCKYPLLLREMIRHTPEDHPDYVALENAFAKINAVVSDINEAQRQAEGLQRILDLQDLIDGIDTLVAPGRKFVKEGELLFYKSPKSKSGEKRTVFFFTDLILLTSKKGERRYEHKMSVPIDSCKLIVIADSNYMKNAFELQQSQLQKKCILAGDNPQESNLWIKEIRALIKGYQKKKLKLLESSSKY